MTEINVHCTDEQNPSLSLSEQLYYLSSIVSTFYYVLCFSPAVDGSLSDNSEEDSSDKEERTNRDGHPIGSGLSAATRMRFEKKRAQYVERQSAEQRPEDEEEEVYKKPSIRAQYGTNQSDLCCTFRLY